MKLIDKKFKNLNKSNTINLEIEICLSCNFKCSYCCAQSIYKGQRIIRKEFFDICSMIKNHKSSKKIDLTLIGGEPLYQKNIKEFLLHLNSLKITYNILTNGVFLNKYYDLLKNSNIIISIHEKEILKRFKNFNLYFDFFNKIKDDKNIIFNYLIDIEKKNTIKKTLIFNYLKKFNNILIRPLNYNTYSKKALLNYTKIINELKNINQILYYYNKKEFDYFVFYFKNNFKFKKCLRNNYFIKNNGDLIYDCGDFSYIGNVFKNLRLLDNRLEIKETKCNENCAFTITQYTKKFSKD